MKIEYTFPTRALSSVPSPLKMGVVTSPSLLPLVNFQPALALRLDIKEVVYSFVRGILNIKWLKTNAIYKIGATWRKNAV